MTTAVGGAVKSPRRPGFARRALRVLGLVLLSVFAAVIGFVFAVWLWWLGDPSDQRSRGVNALWAAHTWVGDEHSEDEYRAFAERMRRYEISDVFFHAGPLEADGSVPDDRIQYADELIAAMGRYAPELRTQAYLGQIEERDGGILDLDDPRVRAGILATAERMLDLGFEGIHYDIEPIYPGDKSFLDLLARTRALTEPRRAVVSVALEQMEMLAAPQRLLGTLTRDYNDPSEDFLEDVAAHVDQVAIMTYDTGLPADWLFGAHVAWQTEHVVELIGDETTVFMGVSTYSGNTSQFHPWAENVDSGVRGVRRGLDRVDNERGRDVGIALFAEWTTSEDEWARYAEAWVRR